MYYTYTNVLAETKRGGAFWVGQYMGQENQGNAKQVQTYLDANAPFAPVTGKK